MTRSSWCVETARVTGSQFAFQSPREVPLCFSHPTLYQSKQLITITDNEAIGRVDRAIKRLRCDMRPNTIGNLVKSDLSAEFR